MAKYSRWHRVCSMYFESLDNLSKMTLSCQQKKYINNCHNDACIPFFRVIFCPSIRDKINKVFKEEKVENHWLLSHFPHLVHSRYFGPSVPKFHTKQLLKFLRHKECTIFHSSTSTIVINIYTCQRIWAATQLFCE